jgi:hypothetical protein
MTKELPVLCYRVGAGEPKVDSIVMTCEACRGGIWVSLGTLEGAAKLARKERRKLRWLCLQCAVATLPHAEIELALSKEQIAELRTVLEN